MAEWRTVIAEDSPAVAEVNRRFVAAAPGFVVVGVVPTAAEARRLVALHRPHLLLLDLGLPDADGLSLLRALRGAREPVEVIAVTAARGARVVRDCVHLGVVDYLVKPFPPERLRQALGLFAHRMQALRDGELAQVEVDRVCASGRRAARALPRDLAPETLAAVRRTLQTSADPLSATAVAERTGVARVTARRYLEFLAVSGEVMTESLIAARPGRPTKAYGFVRDAVTETARHAGGGP
jgi:response regulator of citrate/malate metabolism